MVIEKLTKWKIRAATDEGVLGMVTIGWAQYELELLFGLKSEGCLTRLDKDLMLACAQKATGVLYCLLCEVKIASFVVGGGCRRCTRRR